METLQFNIQGMTCQNCVKHVREALQKVEGVTQVDVQLSPGQAILKTNRPLNKQMLIELLEDEGYQANF